MFNKQQLQDYKFLEYCIYSVVVFMSNFVAAQCHALPLETDKLDLPTVEHLNNTFELRGVFVTSCEAMYSIYDLEKMSRNWLPAGRQINGWRIGDYESATGRLWLKKDQKRAYLELVEFSRHAIEVISGPHITKNERRERAIFNHLDAAVERLNESGINSRDLPQTQHTNTQQIQSEVIVGDYRAPDSNETSNETGSIANTSGSSSTKVSISRLIHTESGSILYRIEK